MRPSEEEGGENNGWEADSSIRAVKNTRVDLFVLKICAYHVDDEKIIGIQEETDTSEDEKFDFSPRDS